jgi:hypothetical protein
MGGECPYLLGPVKTPRVFLASSRISDPVSAICSVHEWWHRCCGKMVVQRNYRQWM